MSRLRWLSVLAVCLLLCGCSLLEREYRSLEPHSHSYREDADKNAFRANNYQDLVNAILLMAEDRQERGQIHIYEEDAGTIRDMLWNARDEVLQQTPAGAYALEKLTWESQAQRDYWEADLSLTYRRTEAEEDAIIDASSSNAVYDLIPFALEEQRQCLAVRFVHLAQTPEELTTGILALQDPQEPAEESTAPEEPPAEEAPSEEDLPEEAPPAGEGTPPWRVYLYPNNENAGIVEIFFWE